MIPAFIVLSFVAIVAGAIYLGIRYEKERTSKLRHKAESMGLTFHEQVPEHIHREVRRLHLFNQGRSRKFKNSMYGNANGVDLAIFDYRYTVGSGKNSTTHHQSVICFRVPGMRAPKFELRPEHFLHRIGQAFGYKDIDFDTHPEFSRRYLLRGEDETAVRAFFTPDRLDYFEATPGVCVEADDDCVIFFRQRKRTKPEDVDHLLKDGFIVYKLFAPGG